MESRSLAGDIGDAPSSSLSSRQSRLCRYAFTAPKYAMDFPERDALAGGNRNGVGNGQQRKYQGAASRHPRSGPDQRGLRPLCDADHGGHGRRRDQGGAAGRRQHPLDLGWSGRGHGRRLRQCEPRQAQRDARPAAGGRQGGATQAHRHGRRLHPFDARQRHRQARLLL